MYPPSAQAQQRDRQLPTAGPSPLSVPPASLLPPPPPPPCHAPRRPAAAAAVRAAAGPEPGIFPRGALEPRVSAARSPGRRRAGVPQLGALAAARPRSHRAPRLPEGPHRALVSVSRLTAGVSLQISRRGWVVVVVGVETTFKVCVFIWWSAKGAAGTRQALRALTQRAVGASRLCDNFYVAF